MRWLLRLFTLLLITGVAAAVWLYRDYQNFLETPLRIAEPGITLVIEPGTSYPAMVGQLATAGLTTKNWHWRVLGRLRQGTALGSYQAGEYFFASGSLPGQVLDRIAVGDVVRYSYTVVEGWSVRQLRQTLAELPRLQRLTTDWSDAQLAAELGLPAGEEITNPLEGWFLPATYDYHYGHSDLDLLQRAHRAMREALDQAWAGRADNLPYDNPYDLLTMASIVEKETGLPDERDQVAGVFVRRLHKGMRLQTDPTIIYGLGAAFDGNLRRVHLRTDGPYNTYTRHGLPPSPIALPGREALAAAAHPAAGDALFFVATGNGGHAFSATLAEHERNVDRYQRRRASGTTANRAKNQRAAQQTAQSGDDEASGSGDQRQTRTGQGRWPG